MPIYNIYAGLGGGFGGASFIQREEHKNECNAENSAYIYACEQYDSYGGMHGLFNQEEALEEDPSLTEEELLEMEEEDRENWIEYYVQEVTEENDFKDD